MSSELWKNSSKEEFSFKHEQIFLASPIFTELMQSVLARGLPFRFQAKGYSMSPFIKDQDIITVFPLKSLQPKLGDIAAFINPETQGLIVHRIIDRRGDYFLINADSNYKFSHMISKENILGLVKIIERRGHRVYLGLGPERFLIAFLNRIGLLAFISAVLRRIIPPFARQ